MWNKSRCKAWFPFKRTQRKHRNSRNTHACVAWNKNHKKRKRLRSQPKQALSSISSSKIEMYTNCQRCLLLLHKQKRCSRHRRMHRFHSFGSKNSLQAKAHAMSHDHSRTPAHSFVSVFLLYLLLVNACVGLNWLLASFWSHGNTRNSSGDDIAKRDLMI